MPYEGARATAAVAGAGWEMVTVQVVFAFAPMVAAPHWTDETTTGHTRKNEAVFEEPFSEAVTCGV